MLIKDWNKAKPLVKMALRLFRIDKNEIPEMINEVVISILKEYVDQPLEDGELKTVAMLMNVNGKTCFSIVALKEIANGDNVSIEISRRIPLTIAGKTKEIFDISELTSKINNYL